MPGRRDPAAIHDEAITWRMRIDEGISVSERQAFDDWLRADPAHRRAYEDYVAMSRLARRLPRHERKQSANRWQLRPVFATAVLAILVLAAAIVLAGQNGPVAQAAVVKNTSPLPRSVRFSDGTIAILDMNTDLLLRFDDHVRRITLRAGRVRFKPSVDPDRPFIVAGGQGSAQATGALLDAELRADQLHITVLRGRVTISADRGGTLSLGARQTGQVAGGSAESATPPDRAALDWPVGRVAFDHALLSTVLERANRDGSPKLVLDDHALAARKVTGVFDLRDTRKLARILAAALDLDLHDEGDTIRLSGRAK